ncbi:hypothetical protein MJD09_14665 [bacterium]|nr:hypothetical protein [bacterium]
MKKIITMSLVAALTLALLVLGCQNLDVQNLNQPDEARALATPSDIESLIKGSFLQWYDTIQSSTPNMSLGVMSDAYTCSWGNFGMGFLSQEPRVEFTNSSTFGRASIAESPWFGNYAAISSTADGIRNIQNGTVDLGPDNARALAFAKFVQGLAHSWLANNFDQGFILDENVDLATDVLELQPYTAVHQAGIGMLEDAISQFNAASFTTEGDWINGKVYTSAELAQIANSYVARYLAAVARTPADRQAVDWNKVLTHLDQGITSDFEVSGNGGGRGDPWFSGTHWYSSESNTWQRLDYKLIGPSDASNAYSDWLALAPADRDEFIFPSTDLRVWNQVLDANGEQEPGLYFERIGNTSYPGGGYQRSRYGQYQFDVYRFETSAGSAIPIFRVQEMDLLRAEALLHLNRAGEVPALLDKTHVTNGGYPSTAGLLPGTINDDPQPQHDKGATLWSVLKYEKLVENLGTSSGQEYFEKRGWGDLTSLTLLHFPVPAKDLETLQLGLYSHGGGIGDSAPKWSTDENQKLRPGPEN